MKLFIIGTGTMGRVLHDWALEDGTFDEICCIEPAEDTPWPEEKPDLLIDFSHPAAIHKIYEYCRARGGGIPVVLATTGYGPEEEMVIRLLEKICPLHRSSNYSRGIRMMTELCRLAGSLKPEPCDVRLTETHHTKKLDAPSGTARSLCSILGLDSGDSGCVQSLRMGNVYGEHTVYFAMGDEIVEIKHTALSKKIFAAGALEAGKKLMRR